MDFIAPILFIAAIGGVGYFIYIKKFAKGDDTPDTGDDVPPRQPRVRQPEERARLRFTDAEREAMFGEDLDAKD